MGRAPEGSAAPEERVAEVGGEARRAGRKDAGGGDGGGRAPRWATPGISPVFSLANWTAGRRCVACSIQPEKQKDNVEGKTVCSLQLDMEERKEKSEISK
jgi:hypothetical protein